MMKVNLQILNYILGRDKQIIVSHLALIKIT